jgi:crossover junction endodeoxyribonuclease RuvC
MIILGIDPGIAITGYGVIHKIGSKHHLISYGTIRTSAKHALSKRLLQLQQDFSQLIATYKPTHVAVEELFFCNNAKTALIVGQARGVILCTAEHYSLPVESYTPLQVKSSVCGYGHAEKSQVQYMVKKLLKLDQIPKPDDAADALAIAICHSHSFKLISLL